MGAELAASDWGLCVGIADYVPEARLDRLPGARADAARFHAWLLSKNGGGVPEAQCALLQSPTTQSETGPKPLAQDIEVWFKTLFRLARANDKAGSGARIGRRLYLYLSGHGVSLGGTREAVLLTADAEPPISCEHVAGKIWADWFRARRVFDEVMLVMDCCRSGVRSVHVNGPPWQILEASRPARQFYAFAAGHGATAREIVVDGQPVGLFTHKLLEFLEDPMRRPLSASGLKGLLYSALSGAHEPVIDVSPNPSDDFEVAPVLQREVGLELMAQAFDDRRDLLVIFDDGPDAPPPRVAPAVRLAGGATLPLSAAREPGHGTARKLVIESDRVSPADLEHILGAMRPDRAALYGHGRPPLHDDARFRHVIAHEADSPALAKVRIMVALDRAPAASLQVVASDPWVRVLVWNASGELLAEGSQGVLLEGVPHATYRVRASIGSTFWTADHVLDGDARIDVPALALDTAAPVGGSSRWTDEDRARLEAVDRSPPVIVVHRGLGLAPRVRGEPSAASVSAGSWTVAGFSTGSARLVLEVPITGRYVALSLPVRREHRTEVYIDGVDGARCPDIAIRVVLARASVGAALTTDRPREALRLALLHGGPNQQILSFAGMEGDPIAALLAAAASGDETSAVAGIVDRAAVVLGEADEDVIAWRGGGGIAHPPLLASSWSRIATSGADVAAGSLADQIAGRRIVLAPWLAWDADAEGGAPLWLRAVAGVMWPAWDSDPASAQAMLQLAAAGSKLGVPSGCAFRSTYKAPPVERLVRHEIAAFVGATNDQLAAALAIAFVERAKRPWQNLTLWSLGDARLDPLQSDRRSGASLRRARDRAEAELVRILPVIARRWRVLRYDGFDIEGGWYFASLWDWQQPGGFVHVSPNRPGEDVRTASKLDIEWPAASSAPDTSYTNVASAYERLRATSIVAESNSDESNRDPAR